MTAVSPAPSLCVLVPHLDRILLSWAGHEPSFPNSRQGFCVIDHCDVERAKEGTCSEMVLVKCAGRLILLQQQLLTTQVRLVACCERMTAGCVTLRKRSGVTRCWKRLHGQTVRSVPLPRSSRHTSSAVPVLI